MHFEVLVEDISGKKLLDIIIPKIIGDEHTFKVVHYKGVGRIPKNLSGKSDPAKRILLTELPKLLKAYGKTYNSYPDNYHASVIFVCDLDEKNLKEFHEQLLAILNSCDPKPETRFCFAIEEGEAWILGDIPAIKKAYPNAKNSILDTYENDSICGTWEKLADAVYPGGSHKLKPLGYHISGIEKSTWAEKITPHMDVKNNKSPSFCYFRDQILSLI